LHPSPSDSLPVMLLKPHQFGAPLAVTKGSH
jgi:hypothetical protein